MEATIPVTLFSRPFLTEIPQILQHEQGAHIGDERLCLGDDRLKALPGVDAFLEEERDLQFSRRRAFGVENMNFFLWMGFPYHIHGDPGGVVGAAELAGEGDDKAFVAGAHKLRKFLRRGTGGGGGRLGGLHVRDQRGDIHAGRRQCTFCRRQY